MASRYKERLLSVCVLALLMLVPPIASQEFCPEECNCWYEDSSFYVICSGLGLTELPHFPETNVQIIDLSDNLFTSIPPELATFDKLEYLDMSSNSISTLPGNALEGMTSLKQLNLAKNNISNWADINPNFILRSATALEELSLAENLFTSFSSNDESLLLISLSLRFLDLSGCKISKISGQDVIQWLPLLERLRLNGNPIQEIADLRSASLKLLDLSNGKLSLLQPTVFSELSSLAYVNLARNYRLTLVTKQDEVVQSPTLRRINLAHCNMDSIELRGFPSLVTAVLRGNMIRQLTRDSFAENPLLENIDLSFNSINNLQAETFRGLSNLKTIDLSFNMIPRVDGKMFKSNEMLTHINLSRNYLSRFSRMSANSLAHLNMSWCEILVVDWDAIGSLPSLVELDLSNNLISDIPDRMSSESLQMLDLSMCRLSTLTNTTLNGLPNLERINFSGNRFTTPFRVDFFDSNRYLSEIWLGDNPWRCDCRNGDFLPFFQYLTDPPGRVGDRKQLRCNSPEDFFGATWEGACRHAWFPHEMMGTTERIWTWILIGILAFCGLFCLVQATRKCFYSHRKRIMQREREENLQELRIINQETRVRLQQEAQLNAPDVRESRPPCYEDAILLPKLDAASSASLDDLLIRSKRRKRRNLRKSSMGDVCVPDELDDIPEIRESSRARSENVLSRRYSPPHTTDSLDYQRPTSNRVVSIADAIVHDNPSARPAQPPELHYHATDILSNASLSFRSNTSMPVPAPRSNSSATTVTIGTRSGGVDQIENFSGYSHSPYAKRKVQPLQYINRNDSIDEITDFEDHQTSPYANRRLGHMSSFRGQRDKQRPTPPPLPPRPPAARPEHHQTIQIVENYFLPPDVLDGALDMDDYAIIPLQRPSTNEPQPSTSGSRGTQRPLFTDYSSGSSGHNSIEIIPPIESVKRQQ